MSDNDGCNGWANRETWALALYINNDQGWQESVHDELRALAAHDDPGATIRENVERLITVDGYREVFGEAIPEHLAVIAEGIGSLWRVNWDEIGAAFLADATEGED